MNKETAEKTIAFLDKAQEKNWALAKFVLIKIVPSLAWYAIVFFIWFTIYSKYGLELTLFTMAVTIVILLGNINGGITGIRRSIEQFETKRHN